MGRPITLSALITVGWTVLVRAQDDPRQLSGSRRPLAPKWAPLVDADNGGSVVASPQTLAKAVAALVNVQTVIAGHATTTVGSGATVSFVRSNSIMTPADLREYADFVRDLMAAADAARNGGKSVDQAVNELKLQDRYRDCVITNARADIRRLYDERAGK